MVLPSAAPAVLANTAAVVPGPMCLGYRVTILGTPGDDVITGTSGVDVIVILRAGIG